MTVHVDNMSAITVATMGGSWRPRYYTVRGAFFKELIERGEVILEHIGTYFMLADALATLPNFKVLATLRQVMNGSAFGP